MDVGEHEEGGATVGEAGEGGGVVDGKKKRSQNRECFFAPLLLFRKCRAASRNNTNLPSIEFVCSYCIPVVFSVKISDTFPSCVDAIHGTMLSSHVVVLSKTSKLKL